MPSPPGSPAPLSRAERARRNGARSRGPVTAAGKARASRNALAHGLRARVHLVVSSEDEAAFAALGTRLFAELAPAGELEGFLVARLAALMWKTGRAERLEAQALAALAGPDAGRLGLALRYQGSVARELAGTLRELRRLRDAPLADDAPDLAPADPGPANSGPSAAAPAVLAAWGGPRPPAGCLLLRPVPHLPAWQWHRWQQLAHPAAAPVLVDEAGNLFAPDGAPLAPPVPPESPPPAHPPLAAAGLRHGLTAADLGPEMPAEDAPEAPAVPGDAAGPPARDGDAKMPNEPSRPAAAALARGPGRRGEREDADGRGTRPPRRRGRRCGRGR